MEIVDKVSEWVDGYPGLYIIGYLESTMDRSIVNTLINHILSNVKVKSVVNDVSYLASFKLKDSVFVLDSMDITSGGGGTTQDRRIISTISSSSYENNNSIIVVNPIYKAFDNSYTLKGGSVITYSATFVCIIANGKLSIKKLRHDNENDYQNVDILQYIRDYKLDILLE